MNFELKAVTRLRRWKSVVKKTHQWILYTPANLQNVGRHLRMTESIEILLASEFLVLLFGSYAGLRISRNH